MSVASLHETRSDEKHSFYRFGFEAHAGAVLRDYFELDAKQAQLSPWFKLYYRLRPFIPLQLRWMMQRIRIRSIEAANDWYLPTAFAKDFREAIRKDSSDLAIHPWPDDFDMAAVLTHDVESRTGMELVDRLAALEERYGVRSAWSFVPHKYKVDEGLLSDLKQRGHEIIVHGYNHDGRLFESRKTFLSRTGPINQAITKFGSVGFRAPMMHRNLKWIQNLEIEYDSSCFDIDPYQAMPGGCGGPWPFVAGKFIELPSTLPQDHTVLLSLGETTPRIWFEKFAYLRSLAGMAMLITHPDYLDVDSRLEVYRQFLEYLVEQPKCWLALPREVARWWRLRDKLQMVSENGEKLLVGPSAERARLFLLSDLDPS